MATPTELLRIVATLGPPFKENGAEIAAGEILDWAEERLAHDLPSEARKLESFECRAEAATCQATSLSRAASNVWAIRLEAQENRSRLITEAAVERRDTNKTVLSTRLTAYRPIGAEQVLPETPEFIHAIHSKIPLHDGWDPFEISPWTVNSDADWLTLIDVLEDSTRNWPILVLSVPEGSVKVFTPLLDAERLAHATAGLARVVILPHRFTWNLTDRFGKERSVFLGAVRVYHPGFSESAALADHPLYLAKRLETPRDRAAVEAELLEIAGEASIRRFGSGQKMRTFSSIRKEAAAALAQSAARVAPPPSTPAAAAPALPAGEPVAPPPEAPPAPVPAQPAAAPVPVAAQESPVADSASEPHAAETPAARQAPRSVEPAPVAAHAAVEAGPGGAWSRFRLALARFVGGRDLAPASELQSARGEITTLRVKLKDAEDFSQQVSDLHAAEEQRADNAEERAKEAEAGLKESDELIAELEKDIGLAERTPTTWSSFTPWCMRTLAGKVVLMERAKREIKKAQYEDVPLAAKGLVWLGWFYRDRRIEGGPGDLGESGDLRGAIDDGLQNARVGEDTFSVDWMGKPVAIKWHLKKGDATTAKRLLRIYYFWDAAGKQVVIASMPGHHRVKGK